MLERFEGESDEIIFNSNIKEWKVTQVKHTDKFTERIPDKMLPVYKDIGCVNDIVHNAGLSKKVARSVPLAVIKGE